MADFDRLERERQEADRRYNDALTALDRELVAATAKPVLARDDLARLATTLLGFLQQITAFVDTKDRACAAAAASEVDRVAPALDAVAELRMQLSVLQRRLRQGGAAPEAPFKVQEARAGLAAGTSTVAASDDYKYVAFEDHFRGSDAAIADRLRHYAAIFAGASDVLDLGCGRGEFLAALKAAGVTARGVDANAEMVATSRDRGLDAVQADALVYLAGLDDESLGGIIATQVIEHLEPAYVIRLLETAASKLRPGAPIVLETINAACWLAFFSSYIRDLTHVRPFHPDTLQYLVRASGFERVTIRYSAPVPDHMKMALANVPADVLSGVDPVSRAVQTIVHTLNANATILNNLMFTHLDCAAIGYRS
jgi:O-antigen chain-terminating methyltransferase